MRKQEISVENVLRNMQELLNEKDKTIKEQSNIIKLLEQKIDYLIREQFSQKSEKLSSNEPSLFDDFDDEENEEIEEEKQEEIKIEYTRAKGGKKRPPEHLVRVRVEHDISDEEKICDCGCKKRVISEVISEQYDVIPATFQVVENVRFKYACPNRCGVAPKLTPLTPQMLPKHQVTPSFLATIAVQKFEDHLPLHRQVKTYSSRFGIEFTTTTFSNWMINASQKVLTPMITQLNKILLQSDYIQADETTLQVLNEQGREARQKSYVWIRGTTVNQKIVLMDYSPTRAKFNANKIFEGFNKGYLQTDGYAGYNDIANKTNIKQLGCWAHIRRKFTDTIKNSKVDDKSKKLASTVLLKIKELYKIEKKMKDDPPDIKQKIREEKSQPIIDNIKEYIDQNMFLATKLNGYIKTAFVYLSNQFPKLIIYLEDGRLNIDNNIAENHVRPIAVGRKNWLFANSTDGAKALANWYSIIETAKMNRLDPYKYLKHILTQIPIYTFEDKSLDSLLPWNVQLD